MYNYNHGIEVNHIESIKIRFDQDNPLVDLLVSEFADSIMPNNWYDKLTQEINLQLKTAEGELKEQITLLKAILDFSESSNYTGLPVNIVYDSKISELTLLFKFNFHEDAYEFLIELWDYLDTTLKKSK